MKCGTEATRGVAFAQQHCVRSAAFFSPRKVFVVARTTEIPKSYFNAKI
jgi:hypothetical protein